MTDPLLLEQTLELARAFLRELPERPVRAGGTIEALRSALGGPLPRDGVPPSSVIERLARGADPGLVATAGPRYFGFVIGGSLPAALAADWLTSAWDQNAGLYATSPAASVVEEVAAGWLVDLFGLPAGCSVGFVTGGLMANFTCLAAGRHEVLRRAGWDVERDGLTGAPDVGVFAGAEAHVTIDASLRLLGLGSGRVRRIEADAQGRMRPDSLRRELRETTGPALVCAQAGNVDTGAFDPLAEIAPLARERGAWLHVDGAFGLWATASPALRPMLHGVELADSWATDAHKWLNVPYDSGLAIVADPRPHRAAMTARAAYLAHAAGAERDPFDWTPEFSRRARGFPIYAALLSLGRHGLAAMIERSCAQARRAAQTLRACASVEVLNEVVLNQVLLRLRPVRGRDVADMTRAVIGRVQREGFCWLSGTTRGGAPAIRFSVSNWSTTDEDVDQSAAALLDAVRVEDF